MYELKSWRPGQPRIDRSLTLQFIGDWGQANFHRICSFLCQEFCDRAGSQSRVAIWNSLSGGSDGLEAVYDGTVDLAILTPAAALPAALKGEHIFQGRKMSSVRALAVLPQNDKMVMSIAGKWGISSFEQLRQQKPALRIATSEDNGHNLIGYIARRFLEAHGIDEETLKSWGGEFVYSTRPEQSLFRMRDGEVDAVVQEAIMTPWWRDAVKEREATVLASELDALANLEAQYGWGRNDLPANFLPNQLDPLPALDFSDFVLVVREDMPEDVAHLLTWCMVEQRSVLEQQYKHIPPEHSPLSYPLMPERMVKTSLPLHPGAERYFREAGVLKG